MSEIATALSQQLFSSAEANAYAVLDGASIPELLKKLRDLKPEHICLYRGELSPDLAECAPYLVKLEPESKFTRWVLNEGWNKHWGIFAVAKAGMKDMRKHFRTFLRVKSPEGKTLYFRYYDPRVLRTYLPTCNREETKTLFGPVRRYLCEDEKPQMLVSFFPDEGAPRRETTKLLDG